MFRKRKYTIILLIFAVTLFRQQTFSQEANTSNKGNINVGVESGIQITGISDPYMPASENGIGYVVGPFFEYYLTNIIKFRAGFNFDNRKFTLGDIGLISDTSHIGISSYYNIKEKYNVNYLTIPLSLIYIKGNDKFNIFIQATLYYSILINSGQSGDLHVYVSKEDAPYYTVLPILNIPGDHYLKVSKDNFNSNDMGINIFFGFTINLNANLGITISPGFTYNFTNVWEDPLRTTTWTHIYKINTGIIYKIN